MIVVASLVGVVASMAFPRLAPIGDRLAVRTAADQFVSAHQKTRAAALRMSRTGQLWIDTDAGTFWVQVDTSLARNGAMATLGEVVDVSASKVSIEATRTVLCFDSRGLPTTAGSCQTPSGAAVVFSRGSAVDSVSITALGMIR